MSLAPSFAAQAKYQPSLALTNHQCFLRSKVTHCSTLALLLLVSLESIDSNSCFLCLAHLHFHPSYCCSTLIKRSIGRARFLPDHPSNNPRNGSASNPNSRHCIQVLLPLLFHHHTSRQRPSFQLHSSLDYSTNFYRSPNPLQKSFQRFQVESTQSAMAFIKK